MRHMGRIVINVADCPQSRRGERFTAEEVSLLVQEVTRRKKIIYGNFKQPPQPLQVRQAWQEIAEIVSSLSGIERSADKCRKRFNDIKRRGPKMASGRKRGRPPKYRPKINDIYPTISNKNVEPEDLEFEVGYQAPLEDDPDYEPSPKKKELVSKVEPKDPVSKVEPKVLVSKVEPKVLVSKVEPKVLVSKVEPKVLVSKVEPKVLVSKVEPKVLVSKVVEPEPPPSNTLLTKARTTTGGHEEHPFLELQQGGFDMLQRELSGFQESMLSLNTRLNQIEVMLRPIGHIADSLARIAGAVERLTCPPTNDFLNTL